MPTVAIVEGVRIVFYANDHPPPHFHAILGEDVAVVDIQRLTVVDGYLPVAKRRLVLTWAAGRQDVLLSRFYDAVSLRTVEPVA